MRYDVAIVLNYYVPYVSGLTEHARIVAEALAARGWRVAVVAARHDRRLPLRETVNGVDVTRCPVVAKVGRGLVSPTFPLVAARVGRTASVVNLHLPMLEASAIARLVRPVPVISTYHIDLWLPPSILGALAIRAAAWSARSALRASHDIVVYSLDQAEHSSLATELKARPLHAFATPCLDRRGGAPAYRESRGLHVGFLGRIVADKGIRYLIAAFRGHADASARLLIGGDYEQVAGGSDIDDLRRVAAGDARIRFLGLLEGSRINDFYASIDVFALPSVAESFGIVQAEAMMTGVPSVTTNIPGGRHPVQATGFGRLVPPRDPESLLAAILQAAAIPASERDRLAAVARARFGVDACIDGYVRLFRSAPAPAPAVGAAS
jgi:glycosyltransferase involved in cell wall biosynthesis